VIIAALQQAGSTIVGPSRFTSLCRVSRFMSCSSIVHLGKATSGASASAGTGTIPHKYCSSLRSRAHRYDALGGPAGRRSGGGGGGGGGCAGSCLAERRQGPPGLLGGGARSGLLGGRARQGAREREPGGGAGRPARWAAERGAACHRQAAGRADPLGNGVAAVMGDGEGRWRGLRSGRAAAWAARRRSEDRPARRAGPVGYKGGWVGGGGAWPSGGTGRPARWAAERGSTCRRQAAGSADPLGCRAAAAISGWRAPT
jgi:hypothetical protein